MSQNNNSRSLNWRGVDLVTTAILSAALGVAFWGFDTFVYPITSTIGNIYPPLSELQLGVWIIPAVLGGVLVRKPGAALYAELIAASLELVLGGNPWSYTVLISGACQAIGVELVLALIRYRRVSLPLAALAGAISAVAEVIYEYFSWVPDYSPVQKAVYMVCGVISGAVIAGGLGWGIVQALGKSGVINAFASGREAKLKSTLN